MQASSYHAKIKRNAVGTLAVAAGCGVVVSVLAIFSLAWGTSYNWPDFVHTDYGFPFVWGTHTTSTIVGPVNTWSVNVLMLIYDLALWFGAIIAGTIVSAKFLQRS